MRNFCLRVKIEFKSEEMNTVRLLAFTTGVCLFSSVCLAQSSTQVAIGPWTFVEGNKTSRETAIETIRKIAEHKGFTVLPQELIERKLESLEPAVAYRKGKPVLDDLARFARVSHASRLIYGRINWHTRSIWVGTGPKTISTATVDAYIFDARSGEVVYEKGVEGRSDEKEASLKVIADVLVTPVVTVVSGGPATPREQRAAQIAIGKALEPWVHGPAR